MTDNAARPNRVLRQHVMTDQLLGVEQVPTHEPSPPPPPPPPDGASPADAVAPARAAAMVSADAGEKAKLLEPIDAEVKQCTKCVLCESRTNTVFGDGDPGAKLLFIGEGPGQNEDQQGKPFVGRAGDLLNKMIVAMGLSREQVYIANIVKCRPPNNRTPLPDEVAACSEYLLRQIEVIAPQVIVTLGGPATKFILDTKKGITSIRGTWFEFNGFGAGSASIPVMPTFHPAFLLRQYTEDNRKKVWSDLQQVMQKLGMAVR